MKTCMDIVQHWWRRSDNKQQHGVRVASGAFWFDGAILNEVIDEDAAAAADVQKTPTSPHLYRAALLQRFSARTGRLHFAMPGFWESAFAAPNPLLDFSLAANGNNLAVTMS